MSKLVFIAHRVGGDVRGNVESVRKICKKVHTADIIPIAPYLATVQYLDDDLEEERELGIIAGLELFKRKVIDELWLCGPTISAGMKEEIELCLKLGIPIKCYNPDLQVEFDEIVKKVEEEKKMTFPPQQSLNISGDILLP